MPHSAHRSIAVLDTAESACLDAAYRFVALAAAGARQGGVFRVALSGGHAPKRLYEMLAAKPLVEAIDWQRTEIFFGDERCVAPESEQSNYKMARETLLARAPIPADKVHRIEGENPDPDAAARTYERALRVAFGIPPGEAPSFDLILLGIGPDGHTASLFPGMASLEETRRLVVSSPAGQEPLVPRVTLTLPVLNAAQHVLFLAPGAEKAQIVARALAEEQPSSLPAACVRAHDTTWLLTLDSAEAVSLPGDSPERN